MQNKIVLLTILVTFVALIISFLIYNYSPGKKLPIDSTIDSIVVHKSRRTMAVYSNGRLLKIYQVALGKNPVGDKEFEGDNKTPEGIYTINAKNPNSAYHKNLGVSYPDSAHIEAAAKLGKKAGGDIKIHGLRNGSGWLGKFHRLKDWTAGCIAVTDEEIDELFNTVQIGAKIEIKP